MSESRTDVQARLGALLLDVPAEHRRGDTVERRGLVQPDERVVLQPVPACAVAAVDDRDACVGVVDERVGDPPRENRPTGAR